MIYSTSLVMQSFGWKVSATVRIVPYKRTAKKIRPKGYRLSICAAILLLLSVICLPPPSHANTSVWVRMELPSGLSNLAVQSRPAAPISFCRSERSTGNYAPKSNPAAIVAVDLPIGYYLGRSFEFRQTRFQTSQFVRSPYEVRAPPFRL